MMHSLKPASGKQHPRNILAHSSWEKVSSSLIFLGSQQAYLIPTRDFQGFSSQETMMATPLYSRTSVNKPWWTLSYAWDYCLVESFSGFLTDSMTLSPKISRYLIESILPSTHCRFPVPEEAKQHQSITAMLHCRQAVVFSIYFIFLSPDIPLIHRTKKFQISFIAP